MPVVPRAAVPPPSVPPVVAEVAEEVVPVAVVPLVVLLVVVLGTPPGKDGTLPLAVGTCPGSPGTAGTVTPPAADPAVAEPTGGVTTVVTFDPAFGGITVTPPASRRKPAGAGPVLPRSVPVALFVAVPLAAELVPPAPAGAATRVPGVFSGSTQFTLRSEQKSGIEVRSLLASAAYAAGVASIAAIARVNVRNLVMAVTSAMFRCKSRA